MKGISALISAVLLVAVTVSAVAIFSTWAPNLVQTVTDSTGNQTRSEVNCNDANLEIVSTRYYVDENTTVVVRNSGNVNLDEINIDAWQNDVPMNRSTLSLNSGDLKAQNVSTTSRPDYVEAIATECDQAQDIMRDIG
jgi:flagellin-like protein